MPLFFPQFPFCPGHWLLHGPLYWQQYGPPAWPMVPPFPF